MIQAAIATMLPSQVFFAGGRLEDATDDLSDGERELLVRSGPRRIADFRAGRFYARRALEAAGILPVEILKAAEGAPIWPIGVCGSISHCPRFCGAAVARAEHLLALGFDVEDDTPLDIELVPMICTADELQVARQARPSSDREIGKLIFSIKESVYKAYAPAMGGFLDFHDLFVVLSWKDRSFEATLVASQKPGLHGRRTLRGRFGQAAGIVFSLCAVPA